MKRMAIIERDREFAIRARHAFQAAGYDVESLERPDGAFDLFLIEAHWCGVVRTRYPQSGIIAVTEDAAIHPDTLAAGADESILKTAPMREVIARANAVLRRVNRNVFESPAWKDRDLQIYLDSLRVIRDGTQTFLSKGEADVLLILLRQSPAFVSVEQIRASVPGGTDGVSRSAIEARLKGLRRKIGADRIANRIGFGYSFHA